MTKHYFYKFAIGEILIDKIDWKSQVQEKREKLEKMMADINNNRNNININQQQLAASQLNQQQTHVI